ncbi:hypothetical protein EYF80_010957 [Liparis tanakae]|uniref:Uncharacterized protein n=1 Tax=Liparis tanakae TaxID=230148 RepID=A0A4Z2ILZ8_9TELE|nr:hypothetical protein EYF80_010957 [Liparis tanakae]
MDTINDESIASHTGRARLTSPRASVGHEWSRRVLLTRLSPRESPCPRAPRQQKSLKHLLKFSSRKA